MSSIEEDLGLTDVQYQTAVSILFVGYVFFGVPSNMLLTRVKPSVYLTCIMLTWAIVSICTAFARNYTGLLMTRFFLGALEAPYYPGALLIISTFYTRTEVATRISILYLGNILATAFAGLIAAGIFELEGVKGYAGWQWLFIIVSQTLGSLAKLTILARSSHWCGRPFVLRFAAQHSTHHTLAQAGGAPACPRPHEPRQGRRD